MNRLVVEKNKKNYGNYTYGSVAYDLEPKVVKEKKVVKQKAKKRNVKNKLKLMVSIVIITICSFGILTRYAAITKKTYNIRSIKSDISKMQKQNENISVDIAKQNNIRSIETVAVGQYGMVMPENNSLVYVDVKPLTPLKAETPTNSNSFFHKILGFIN